MLANKVKVDFDVLGESVKNWICHEVGCFDIVTVKDRSGGEGKT